MISKEQALRIVRRELDHRESLGDRIKLRLVEDATIEEDFGWIFFYNSEEFFRTGDFSMSLAGNAPLIVDRDDGSLHVTGTARHIRHYINEYRAKRNTK